MTEWICLGIWGVAVPIGWHMYASLSKRIDAANDKIAGLGREAATHSAQIASQEKQTDKLDREIFDPVRHRPEPLPKGRTHRWRRKPAP